jgi:aspartyl-tRNA(Asn)/glutamyl-tRNA(Gln) amidotransferase subunit B
MQEGSFRCDANVSVRPVGQAALGTRCEIKNLNSFRFLEKAIEFEVRRQIELIEDGGQVVQETRLYDSDKDETRPMRSKEDAQDYRYFPDPDLPPLAIDAAWIARVGSEMPELPKAMQARFAGDHGLPLHDAVAMTATRETARYFEAAMAALPARGADAASAAKIVANWIQGELVAALHRTETEIAASPVSPEALARLVTRIQDGTLSGKLGKDVFDALWAGEPDVDAVIDARGLRQISDEGALAKVVDDVLAANPAIVAEVRAGREKAFNSLVGKAMAATKGRANPAQVNALLKERLAR